MSGKNFLYVSSILCLVFLSTSISLASPKDEVHTSKLHSFRLNTIAEGLAHPWSLAFLPDGKSILVTEREGRLRIIRNGRLLPKPIANTPDVFANGQGGLFDVILDPDYAKNKQIYLSYAKQDRTGAAGTEIMRAKLSGFELLFPRVIFKARPKLRSSHHFGGRMGFDTRKNLYLTTGDRGNRTSAQDSGNHLGSVIRISKNDGSPAPKNPFLSDTSGKFAPEVFSFGHRNPQGLAFEPGSSRLWVHEHGPKGGDELNLIQPGKNYGWPVLSFGRNYDGSIFTTRTTAPGMEPPVFQWTPSIAPSGMVFYEGKAFPKWKGHLFVGALKFRQIQRLEIKDGKLVGQEILLKDFGERIRDLRLGPDGMLYLLTDSDNGKLLRLEPVAQDSPDS